jgi:hypothetical protein
MNRSHWVLAAMLALVVLVVAVPATAMAKGKTLTVCKHGCKYDTIQDAVDDAKKNTTINVKPGTYKEGVLAQGHKYDGLTIQGTKKDASKVVLQGKNAKDPDGQPANNGIETVKADDVTLKNMTAKNYLANGFHVVDCDGYLMDNLVGDHNRAYGLFAFDCIGGRMTNSVGFGQGDSAFYVGETPVQSNPKTTKLDHLDGHENVLGYSGTNSKYVTITKSAFYNNGVGVVPNTLDSERFEPTADGVIKDNAIFWNNFNYFLPNSGVGTVGNGGLGTVEGIGTIQYPTGIGVVLLGADGWVVEDNEIFGNFKAGTWTVSDPTNEGDNAISMNNQWLNNQMGRGGTDTNQVDFFSDGSGSANCFSGNVSSTFDPSSSTPNAVLYPTCPAPAGTGGNGASLGDTEQFGEVLTYVTTDPPEKQQCSWQVHDHPAYKNYKPVMVTPGPTC